MFLIAMAAATMTPPDRWVRVSGTDVSEEFLDLNSVSPSGDKVTLWTRRTLVPDLVTSWNELEIDCSMRTASILAYIRDDRGTISHNAVRPHREASAILPNSIEQRIFDIVCS